jgi:hypothetical protein
MLLATGNINQDYEIVGVVHAVIVKKAESTGCSAGGLPIEGAYKEVTQTLFARAQAAGASGVIHIGYDHRVSTSRVGCTSNTIANFEVYAWGTAIKLSSKGV